MTEPQLTDKLAAPAPMSSTAAATAAVALETGLSEPDVPPLSVCGGLERAYVAAPAAPGAQDKPAE